MRVRECDECVLVTVKGKRKECVCMYRKKERDGRMQVRVRVCERKRGCVRMCIRVKEIV